MNAVEQYDPDENEPLQFSVCMENGKLLPRTMKNRIAAMANLGLTRALRELDGQIVMTFAADKVTFKYTPAPQTEQPEDKSTE